MPEAPKIHKLKGLFIESNKSYPLSYVLEETGIVSSGSLRVQISRINKQTKWKIVTKFGYIRREE